MSNQIITSELLLEDPGLIDLIDRFISRLPNMQAAIVKAYSEKDWEHFTSLIHQMKGVGGNYGYPMLTDLCADIEVKAKEKDENKVDELIKKFEILSLSILSGKDENHNIIQ